MTNTEYKREQDEAVDTFAREYEQLLTEEAEKLGVTRNFAEGILYFRERSRWTQRAEDELIRMFRAGERLPNMMEWPPKDSPLRDS